MAARTRRVRFSSDICLLPFSHPVRLAEDLAVLDNLSGGRIEIGVGMGYAPHEFRGFGIPIAQRLSRTEEGLEVLRRCFSGERFSFHGKRYDFDDVVIRPGYVQPGGPPLWVAAMSEAGALRAARLGCHLLPQGPRDEVLEPWRRALAASGRDPDAFRGHHPRLSGHRRSRARLAPVRPRSGIAGSLHALLRRGGPSRGLRAGRPRIPQTWVVGDVAHCVRELSAFIAEHGITDLVTWAVPPGLHPQQMNASLERFARDVVPRLRAAIESGPGEPLGT
jgi:alkanesulfonate monooxygenase SsuD/methylene tetrahydromethanopterin reductase-like flavin-dependent oxidoreductase (luciferase family)